MPVTAAKVKLDRATPESLGFSSKSVLGFIKNIEDRGIETHSFMIIRDGKVGAEGWFAPYNADTPHALYSFSKSFASIAVGYLIDEKVVVPKTGEPITLETRLMDIFPSRKKKAFNKNDEALTIRQMLRMRSGKKMNLLSDKSKIDWIDDYMNAPFGDHPGDRWNYCNENSFMLCATVKELTGQSVIEYLTPRFFEPLGIDIPFWEVNQQGVESGGWGLYLKTEDMAKFILTMLNGGKFGGRQIIPADWAKVAVEKQSDNSEELNMDSKHGYGYHFWLNGGADGFRADGMFSQHGIAIPSKNAVIVVTCACPMEQVMLDCIWDTFPEAFQDAPLPEDEEAFAMLQEKCASLSLKKLSAGKRYPEKENEISANTYKLRKKLFANMIGFPSSMLALPITFMGIEKAGNITNLNFDFSENEVQVTWTEDGGKKLSVPVGLDGEYRYGRMDNFGPAPFTSCSIGRWNEDGTLEISIRPLEAISERHMVCSFEGDRITVKMGETPDVSVIGEFLLHSFSVMFKSKAIVSFFKMLFKIVPYVLDPKLKGRKIK